MELASLSWKFAPRHPILHARRRRGLAAWAGTNIFMGIQLNTHYDMGWPDLLSKHLSMMMVDDR
jgi:hypothetical protein